MTSPRCNVSRGPGELAKAGGGGHSGLAGAFNNGTIWVARSRQVTANVGERCRAEVLSRAEAVVPIGACSATSRTGIPNRSLITPWGRLALVRQAAH